MTTLMPQKAKCLKKTIGPNPGTIVLNTYRVEALPMQGFSYFSIRSFLTRFFLYHTEANVFLATLVICTVVSLGLN
ncbi:hypothetical protein SAMN04488136_106151 [Vibrio xiamenensis]|uniref:Uncharacterized protein n=1 Tax=Vibrio xiamenensis TaxID=861298 RepID=A0A1G7Z080_9VIBR|nr:hypothetical protein SAMN04488136_106151 [Vibrio xiamenensis]